MSKSHFIIHRPSQVLTEGMISDFKDKLQEYYDNTNVKKMIALAQRNLSKNTITDQTADEVQQMLKDPKVRAYILASEAVGRRIGWIKGGIAGTLLGGAAGAVIAASSALPILALAALGAVAGGLSIGFVTSRIIGLLRRWETEENITIGKGDSTIKILSVGQ